MAFYELRHYRVLPGKMDEWVRCMEETIIPFQVARGMVIAGSFPRRERRPDLHLDAPVRLGAAARGSCTRRCTSRTSGRTDIAPQVEVLIDRTTIEVTRLVATPKSVLR